MPSEGQIYALGRFENKQEYDQEELQPYSSFGQLPPSLLPPSTNITFEWPLTSVMELRLLQLFVANLGAWVGGS